MMFHYARYEQIYEPPQKRSCINYEKRIWDKKFEYAIPDMQ